MYDPGYLRWLAGMSDGSLFVVCSDGACCQLEKRDSMITMSASAGNNVIGPREH